jgi:hypothetical protein
MSIEAALQFTDADRVGNVSSVDTSRVSVAVSNSPLLTRIGIGNLMAIRGSTEHEYLIAVIERVTRSLTEEISELEDETSNELSLDYVPRDHVKGALIGTFRSVEGEKSNTFKRGADSFPQIDRECYVIEGGNLQRFMGILGAEVPEEERLVLGTFVADASAQAIASGDRFFQRHAAILGSTGSGKSWTVALILERASKLKFPNILVFDMHGEYAPLSKAGGGFASYFRIAGPGDLEDPGEDVLFLPYWLLNRDEMLSMILDRSDQNAPNQASRFTGHVREVKHDRLVVEGKSETAKTFTVDSPVPYSLRELVSRLETDNTAKGISSSTGKEIKGEWEDKLTRFISRLQAKVEDRRYGFMFSPPTEAQTYEWLGQQIAKLLGSQGSEGIKIIDFSEVPSDVLPVVTGTLSRLLYDVQFWTAPSARTPVTLLCDEAHLYLPLKEDADAVQKQALGAFERIAKEGRKYGFSILVVSQRPADVSRTILSQCNNFMALRLTNETDQGVIKRLMPDSLAGMTSILPLLDTGEALLLGDAVLLPTRVKLDQPTLKPDSATRQFWQEWGTTPANEDALAKAVECLRSQTRPRG